MQTDGPTLDQLLASFSPDHSPWVALGQDIGGQALQRVLEHVGGTKPHVPMPDSFRADLVREIRDTDIRARFNGTNYDELSADTGLTPRQIRRIVHGPRK